MQWVDALYNETKAAWYAAGCPPAKYDIFFSPVFRHPKVALIGYNPGGDGAGIDVETIQAPADFKYLTVDYRIALGVRKIFSAAGLSLRDTVKFNLIFFRTKAALDLKKLPHAKELIHFSEQKVVAIVAHLQPQYIITEGFATFTRLLQLHGGHLHETVRHNNRAILQVGSLPNGTPVFGMLHPSGAFGISNNVLVQTGYAIKDRLIQS